MNTVFVKLKQRNANKFRKILSTDEILFPSKENFIYSTVPYSAGASLEEGEWFFVTEFSSKPFCMKEIVNQKINSVDYDSLEKHELENADFLFTTMEGYIYFQKVSKAKLIKKKSIFCIGEDFKYNSDCQEIIINDLPDAVYEIESDTLLFHRLESITSIFNGIIELHREATEQETLEFLNNDFISLKDDYNADKVKTANRKRIALAMKTLESLSHEDRNNIFSYIFDYCPDLKFADKSFGVGSEDDLKRLLFGIEQRFYTTPVGGEKRLANSVIPLG